MTIDNLFRLISEKAPRAVRTIAISDLRGFKIGIDTSIAVYQWYSVGLTRKIVNLAGKFINHIQGAFFRTAKLRANGINLLYILDGKPPEAKAAVLAERRKLRVSGQGTSVPTQAFEEVKELLTAMGVGVMVAPSEAEAQGAVLTQNGTLDAIATEDMDALVFGAKCVIRGLNSAGKNVTMITRADVLTELGLTNEQFIDLAILLGSDYTSKITGIGPVKALNLIRKHGSIENILNRESVRTPFDFNYELARKEFSNPIIANCKLDLCPKTLSLADVEKIKSKLLTWGLSSQRIEKTLEKLT